MKHQLIVEKLSTGMHYLCLDEKIVKPFIRAQKTRLVCRLNGNLEFHCALLKRKCIGFIIYLSKAHCKTLKLKQGMSVAAEFFEDTSQYGLEMPVELAEVLHLDEYAEAKFRALAPGNQRSLLYLVSKLKSGEKRIERALKIAYNLKRGIHSAKEVLK